MTTKDEGRPLFWDREPRKTARLCWICGHKLYAWHDAQGRHWEMCQRCDKP